MSKGRKAAICDCLAAALYAALAIIDQEPFTKIALAKLAVTTAAASIGGALL